MTESQVALHGGAWWVGPLFLAGYLVLYWYLDNAPLTRGGRQRSEQRAALAAAERRLMRAELERRERSTQEGTEPDRSEAPP
jgi:hypothetical protein